jgi:hypothetical protein
VFPRVGGRRVAVAAVAALVVLSGCSKPPNLDHQEQVAFARACASLIERNVVQADPPIRDLAGEALNLDDPADFYAKLEKLRGPDTFNFDDPGKIDRSPKDLLDDPCRPRTHSDSSSTSTNSTSNSSTSTNSTSNSSSSTSSTK